MENDAKTDSKIHAKSEKVGKTMQKIMLKFDAGKAGPADAKRSSRLAPSRQQFPDLARFEVAITPGPPPKGDLEDQEQGESGQAEP